MRLRDLWFRFLWKNELSKVPRIRQVSALPPDFSLWRLRHLLDDLGQLVEHLADLTLRHNQRRAHSQRIADRAEHDAMLEEAEIERLHAAFADAVGLAGEIDADREADRANVEHVGQARKAHG